LLPFLGTIVNYYSFLRYGQHENFKEVLYVGSASLIVMINAYVLIFYMFWQLHEKYIGQEQRRILTLQNRAQLEQHVLFKEAAEKSNRRWHDLRHTNHALIQLLEKGDTTTALQYVKEQMNIDTVYNDVYCQHPEVNTILCLWVERCKNEGIYMKIIVSMPETLKIDPMELSAVFANAIENAFHACLTLPPDINRFIKVETQYNGKRLSISVTNTCKDDVVFEGGIPISQQEGGGIGTQSIIYTVKRFHGAYTFKAHEGLFFTRLVLNV
jgi:sensor histidine kinase regulating citrate/malate metabolism